MNGLNDHYWRMLLAEESRMKALLELQDMDPDSPDYGGIMNSYGYIEPAGTMWHFNSMTVLYYNNASIYAGDESVFQRMSFSLVFWRESSGRTVPLIY
jgi:hypothetical protein